MWHEEQCFWNPRVEVCCPPADSTSGRGEKLFSPLQDLGDLGSHGLDSCHCGRENHRGGDHTEQPRSGLREGQEAKDGPSGQT